MIDGEGSSGGREAAMAGQRDENADVLPVDTCATLISHCKLVREAGRRAFYDIGPWGMFRSAHSERRRTMVKRSVRPTS